LKPFGYDLFTRVPTTFAPVSDVPVSAEYVVGPGDVIEVQLLGSSPDKYSLVVGRDGRISLPELGPVAVAGMRFAEVRDAIERRVSEQMIGTRAVVTMGELRAITVFITGEAERPGSYSVSSLSTVTNALFASGGVSKIGSLRNIQVKRGGSLVATLDLYDLLLRGDTRNDVRLQSGDVIFIPPVGKTVGVTGEIRRPAIYEFTGEATAADLLYLAGGLLPEADPRATTIERIGDARERIVVDVDLSSPAGRGAALRAGDLVRINAVRPSVTNAVTVNGHAVRTGPVAWRSGLRLTDVLTDVEDLKPGADQHYVLIRREAADRKVSTVSADLARAWREPASEANPLLQPRDAIYVFNLEGGRERDLRGLLEEMDRQAGMGAPAQTVGVGGRVKAPGRYPLEVGMTVSDLIRAGAGLDEAAYGGMAELTRYEIVGGEYRQAALLEIDLGRVLAGDAGADFVLQPYDFLVIKELPQWTGQETVTLGGEVRFPGTYPIKRGETLGEVLKRAGGLTDLAFAEGAVFTRESLREREAQQIAALADRLQGDLAALALQATQGGGSAGQAATQAVAVGQSLLDSLREIEPVGRLVIDLDQVLAAQGSHYDVVLKDGDRLLVPGRMQEVTVLGEVQSGTSHLWHPSLGRDDYIHLSGGPTQKADEGRIYVVRANGSVVSGDRSRWFRNTQGAIRPGDSIVVPLDAERMRPLPLWTAVTTIIYNLAISVAAVNSF
jgi:protein involved in polysaccharide export with SLBB domain